MGIRHSRRKTPAILPLQRQPLLTVWCVAPAKHTERIQGKHLCICNIINVSIPTSKSCKEHSELYLIVGPLGILANV